MFSVITNIYIKKTKGLNGIFHSHRKTEKDFFLTTRDVRCVSVCDKILSIVSMCAVSPVVHTSNIFTCKKNHF